MSDAFIYIHHSLITSTTQENCLLIISTIQEICLLIISTIQEICYAILLKSSLLGDFNLSSVEISVILSLN